MEQEQDYPVEIPVETETADPVEGGEATEPEATEPEATEAEVGPYAEGADRAGRPFPEAAETPVETSKPEVEAPVDPEDVDLEDQTVSHLAGVLPTDIDGYAYKHGLSVAEASEVAEAIADGESEERAVEKVRDNRTINRLKYETVEAGDSHPMHGRDRGIA